MASNPNLVQYIADQMARAGEITSKKMFGEYGLYCNGKFFAMVCDDRLLFKPCFYIEDVDDHELLVDLTKITCKELPEPKLKK